MITHTQFVTIKQDKYIHVLGCREKKIILRFGRHILMVGLRWQAQNQLAEACLLSISWIAKTTILPELLKRLVSALAVLFTTINSSQVTP